MAAPTRIPASKGANARTGAATGTHITSRDNQWLRTFRAALRSSRPEENRIALEGAHLVAEAIRSGLKIEALLVSTSGEKHLAELQSQLDHSTHILRTSDKLFASVADTETPQGIAALARAPESKLEDMLIVDPLVIVLVAAQNPGNVGAILRSAEAFGATGVIATRGTAHPYSPKALRASSGYSLQADQLLSGVPRRRHAPRRRKPQLQLDIDIPISTLVRHESSVSSGLPTTRPLVRVVCDHLYSGTDTGLNNMNCWLHCDTAGRLKEYEQWERSFTLPVGSVCRYGGA